MEVDHAPHCTLPPHTATQCPNADAQAQLNGDIARIGSGNDAPGVEVTISPIMKGHDSGVEDEVYKVISSTATWNAFWKAHVSIYGHEDPPSAIDFERNVVIAAFRGTQGSSGYGVTITKVRDTADALVVYVETRDPPPGCMTLCALTQPFHMVECETRLGSKPVKFVTEQWQPPPPSSYTVMVGFEREEDATNILNRDVKSLQFVNSVHLLGAVGIGMVEVNAAFCSGEVARETIERINGVKYAELDGVAGI